MFDFRLRGLVCLLVLVAAGSAAAQEVTLPKTPIQFTVAKAGDEGSLELTVGKPVTVTQQFTVDVPIEKTVVDEDGNAKTVTVMVQESRVRNVMKMFPETFAISGGSYKVYRMSGAKLSETEIATALRAPQKVILVQPHEKLDVWYRDVVKPETLVVVRMGEPSVPDLPPPPPDGGDDLLPPVPDAPSPEAP